MSKLKKILKYAAIVLIVLIGVPLIIGQILRIISPTVPPPGKMVDVGGYKLHINCVSPEGKGDENLPTVVFEAGAGVSSPANHWIQEGVSKTTKVCVYDRAGLGWSEESNLPRDAKTVNTALHTLLDKAGVKRPFVFAGHSIAGLYMRDYVERYPDDVVGLVFLDPSHPDQNNKLGLTAEKRAELLSSLDTLIKLVKVANGLGVFEFYNPLITKNEDFNAASDNIQKQTVYLSKQTSIFDTTILEVNSFDKAAEQAAINKTLGDRPIVVISATKEMQPGLLPEGISPKEFQANFVKLHDEITALSTNGKHIKMSTADHMSLITNRENAAKVVPYIVEVVKKSTEKTTDAEQEKTEEKAKAAPKE